MAVENTIRYFRPPIPLTGNCFNYGRIGSGKSWKMLAIIQFYLENNYKIWDIFGGKRGEGPFWCFPSDEKRLWETFKNEVGSMTSEGPKEYNVDLIYPFFYENIPDELPELLPRIKSKLVTFYFKDITAQDITLVLGNLTATAKYVWSYIVKNLPDDANGEDILNLFENKNKLSKHKETSIYRLFIKPLCDNKLLSGKEDSLNIDIIKESKEIDRVFVFCDDYIPEEFKLFCMGYVLTLVFKNVLANKIHKQNIAVFREMSLFMKVQDASTELAEQKQIFRNIVSDIARYARSGLFIFGDTQSPYEVKGLIEGQDDLLCISEMPSHRDREELCDQLKRDQRISDLQIAYIATMPIERLVVIARGQRAKLIKRLQPPRNKCWKQGDGNFISVYRRLINKFCSVKESIQHVVELHKTHRYKIEKELEDNEGGIEEESDDFPNEKTLEANQGIVEEQTTEDNKVETIEDTDKIEEAKINKSKTKLSKKDKADIANRLLLEDINKYSDENIINLI